MEKKKSTKTNEDYNELFSLMEANKDKGSFDSDNSWIWLLAVASIFGSWGDNSRIAELDKKFTKLEGKIEIIEKLVTK